MANTKIEVDGKTAAEIAKQLRDAAGQIEKLNIEKNGGKIDLDQGAGNKPLMWKVTYDTNA